MLQQFPYSYFLLFPNWKLEISKLLFPIISWQKLQEMGSHSERNPTGSAFLTTVVVCSF